MFAYQIITPITDVPKFIGTILSAYPICTLTDTFQHLNKVRWSKGGMLEMKINDQFCIEQKEILNCIFLTDQNVFSWNDGIGKDLVLMICVSIAVYIILIVIEAGAIKMIKQYIFPHIKRTYPNDNTVTDDDVRREKERIDRMGLQQLKSETLAMKDVSKFYGSLCAVNKTSIAIKGYDVNLSLSVIEINIISIKD